MIRPPPRSPLFPYPPLFRSSWTHLGLMIGMYLVSILGVTIGYHRLFTHKSFETSQFMKVFLAICGSMAVEGPVDRKSTRLNSSHSQISYAVFCLKKKKDHRS